MEVEEGNEDTFLDDSEDTGESEEETQQPMKEEIEEDEEEEEKEKTNNKKKGKKPQKVKKEYPNYVGKSNTIILSPIPRGTTESAIVEFVKTAINKEPLSVSIIFNHLRRISRNKESPLYDACRSFVVLPSIKDATKCANELNTKQFAGFTAKVFVAAPANKNDSQLKDETTWVKITNIPKDALEQDVLTHIQKYSKITKKPKNVYLYHHLTKDNYPGYVYVECNSTDDANNCVKNLRNTELNGNKLWCSWRTARKELDTKKDELEGKTKQVVLGNLHYTLSEDQVKELCAKYGEVDYCTVWYDKSGYPQGSAVVSMKSEEDAQKVFVGLQDDKVKNLSIRTGYTQYTKRERRGGKGGKGGKGIKGKSFKAGVLKNKKINKKITTSPKGGEEVEDVAEEEEEEEVVEEAEEEEEVEEKMVLDLEEDHPMQREECKRE
eukprot:CAMPEP_0201575610 /NCGR_PEP_ID=MMETSP0190_2-20130828/20920_1 /ASSEMBLY_ACC=CAM_ASM_000263 /TAXON_ID=37353 /ORGANISM="Rosalina sp." /LENGTH=436 /DNA_ID=CAMNT_0048005463 /DNA_START=83 /DNA_END=1394 /DNA_ORIENTATION=-